jgi:hypothetical protein
MQPIQPTVNRWGRRMAIRLKICYPGGLSPQGYAGYAAASRLEVWACQVTLLQAM